MSHHQVKDIAAEAPTTMEELAHCGLPMNIQKTYGERLIKNVTTYIEMHNLQSYLDNRPKKKLKSDQVSTVAAAAASAVAPDIIDVIDSGDEFENDDIDFSAIEMPVSSNAAASSNPNTNAKSELKSSKSSSYFK